MTEAPSVITRGGEFDFLVVGGGSAGFAAAIQAADLGARVAMVEGATLGGTCVNVGCVPSKTLIRAAEAHHRRVHHGFRGIPTTDGQPDWPTVRAQKDALVAELRQTKYWSVLQAYLSITLFQERATFVSGREVRLASGRTLTAGKIVVTTGSSPWAAPIPGLADAGYLDSASAMALERLPQSLVVIGGSAVGLELAQMFARLGVRVTVLEALPRVVPAEDADIGNGLADYLRSEGLDVHTDVGVDRVTRGSDGYEVHYHVGSAARIARAEQLLVATGRRANTAGFGLDTIGVSLGSKGEIAVDEFLQTTNPSVYAAGDVIGEPMFVYVAAYAGALAAENALTGNERRYDLSALAKVTFTDPAISSVGLTENEARAQGIEPLVSKLPLEHVPRALAAHDTRGFIKLVADAATKKIIGAHILAAEAGETITEPTLAVKFGLTVLDPLGRDQARRAGVHEGRREAVVLRGLSTLSALASELLTRLPTMTVLPLHLFFPRPGQCCRVGETPARHNGDLRIGSVRTRPADGSHALAFLRRPACYAGGCSRGRSSSAFTVTVTVLALIASAAHAGLSRTPSEGYNTPAASGMAIRL